MSGAHHSADHKPATWGLLRGEQCVAQFGVHPKAIEYYDYVESNSDAARGRESQDFDFGFHKPAGEPPLKLLRGRLSGSETAAERFTRFLASQIRAAAARSAGYRIIFRTSDLRSNDIRGLLAGEWLEGEERNPSMGMRGLGRYLHPAYRRPLAWELDACGRAASAGNCRLAVIFPLVRDPVQLIEALSLLAREALPLAGTGIMLETPTNVMNFEDFASALIGAPASRIMLLFGLSDLTQATYSAGRSSPRMSEFHRGLPTGIRRMIEHVVSMSARMNRLVGEPMGRCLELGLHSSRLEGILKEDEDWGLRLRKSLSFLVEDHYPTESEEEDVS